MAHSTKKFNSTLFEQIIREIPVALFHWLDQDSQASKELKARKFSYSSHLVALLYGHLSHACSLTEICDVMNAVTKTVGRIRGCTVPKRNTLSYANRNRNPGCIEEFYWKLAEYLNAHQEEFGLARFKGRLAKFKHRTIAAIDSSMIQLIHSCIDWAKHRANKAAIKLHIALDVGTRMPTVAIIGNAVSHDSTKAYELCNQLKSGDILIADRAYNDFKFFKYLEGEGINYVVREKSRLKTEIVETRPISDANVVSDNLVRPTGMWTSLKHPDPIRRIEMKVEIDGKETLITFLTNNRTWAPSTIAALYKARWSIEIFFKEIKQTLQIRDFYGENENAIRWQIFAALICHLLTRFIAFTSKWKGTYWRLTYLIGGLLWQRLNLYTLLGGYWTTAPRKRRCIPTTECYLPGLEALFS